MKIVDDFSEPCAPGHTLGTRATSGALRLGVDRERCIAVDHGALRFQPLLRDGWGRQGLSYGPLGTAEVTAFAVGILNGHNTSQAGHLEQSFVARFRTWLRAGGTQSGRERALRFLRYGRHRATARQMLRWLLRAPRIYRSMPLDENLAVGFYDAATPCAPQNAEVGFVMHAAGPENGELWVRVLGQSLPVLRGVQNVPLLLLMVQRGQAVTYYVASSEAAQGVARLPFMRPVAVTPHRATPFIFPGIHQSALGQVGFRVDTRVYGVRVESRKSDLVSVLLEDTLTDRDEPPNSVEPRSMRSLPGFVRDVHGLRADSPGALAWQELSEAAGLVHVLVEESEEASPALLFGDAEENAYAVQVGHGKVILSKRTACVSEVIAEASCDRLAFGAMHALLLMHEQRGVVLCLDGRRLFDQPSPLAELRRVGFWAEQATSGHFRNLEAHPQAVLVPRELQVALPSVAAGHAAVIEDDFTGGQGDLAGREVKPGLVWRKELGAARFSIGEGGRGAVVTDARTLTARARTIYTLPWPHPELADLSIAVMPPGAERGQGEEGRAGLVFWQDPDNYVIVGTWLHDKYGGASISSFYCLGGFEDVYDAVWTNVGSRVRWGVPYELRVAFDGARFTALLDGEAVLQRALSDVRPDFERLSVRRVGIVANWEWGNDTGSEFRRFVARKREPSVATTVTWLTAPARDQTVA